MKNQEAKGKLGRFVKVISGAALLVACGAGDQGMDADELAFYDEELELGSAEQELSAACGGDDSNALSAALAVAIGKELGRWDVNTDFVVSGGKLQLSATGTLHCGSGCGNVKDLLRLQDDVSSVITNHSPATYRSKLTGWYGTQKSKLDNLVLNTMLNVDKGVYRIKSVSSKKYIVPAGGSTSNGASLQQSDQYTGTTASQWRVVLKGGTHQLINVKSGMCMGFNTKSGAQQNAVQMSCNTGDQSQAFRFSEVAPTTFAVRTGYLQSLDIAGGSTSNNASIIQYPFGGAKLNQQFVFERVGSGPHVDLKAVATAVYQMKFLHSGLALGVSSGSLNDGTSVVQQPYSATDDRFHWYITPAVDGTSRYQFINRRTGSCLDMLDPNSSGATAMVQRKCSTAESQKMYFTPTGNGPSVVWTTKGQAVEVAGASRSGGAQVVQGGKSWADHNMLTLTPVTAGEPHRLKFNRKEAGGPCGDYHWFDVTQPNGVALDSPASTYVQLIFAGGKQSPSGNDVNPFIAQRVSGNQVAIDPTYGLNEGSSTSTGSCTAACLKISSANIVGACCACAGVSKKFKKSAWSATTHLCQ